MPERRSSAIFGKSWDLHVSRALGITEEENLTIISETVRYLKDHGKEVVYDAEHFFDGYIHNRDFALRTLEAAKTPAPTCSASAIPTAARCTEFLAQIVADVRAKFDGVIGIHTHNDSDVAVANTLAAVREGRNPRAGLPQRLWRALRQLQSRLRHRQLELKLGHTDHRPGEAAEAHFNGPLHRRTGQSADRRADRPSSARAPSPIKAASTSAP